MPSTALPSHPELVDGHLVEDEDTGALHSAIASWLVWILQSWLGPRGGFVLISDTRFGVGPRRGRKPDISVYFAGRKPPAPGPFPSPLGPVERAALGEVKGTLDAVGESSVRWLGRDDTLLIDSLLVIPGRQAVELHGDVAR